MSYAGTHTRTTYFRLTITRTPDALQTSFPSQTRQRRTIGLPVVFSVERQTAVSRRVFRKDLMVVVGFVGARTIRPARTVRTTTTRFRIGSNRCRSCGQCSLIDWLRDPHGSMFVFRFLNTVARTVKFF